MAIRTRRLAAAAGMVMAVVATGGVVTATPASAAQGTLRINNETYRNPSGCYDIHTFRVTIDNDTDENVYVFTGPDCSGSLADIVEPGDSTWTDSVRSVLVP